MTADPTRPSLAGPGPAAPTWALALVLVLPGCGQPSLQVQVDQLQARADAGESGDLCSAAEALLARAASEGAEPALVWRLEKLALLADARAPRADAARQRLGRLADAGDRHADPALSSQVAQLLSGAGDHAGALAVLDDAVGRWPAAAASLAPAFAALEQAMTASGDDAALAALQQLPYLR